jgi:hypothetical protein
MAETLIGDRNKSQQGGEEQSAGKEAFQNRGKTLTVRRTGHDREGPPKIEIDQDARRERQGSADEIGHDQILLICQL